MVLIFSDSLKYLFGFHFLSIADVIADEALKFRALSILANESEFQPNIEKQPFSAFKFEYMPSPRLL